MRGTVLYRASSSYQKLLLYFLDNESIVKSKHVSFFHLLVNGFSVTSFRTFFLGPLTILILVGGIGGRGEIQMVSASTPSANEPAKDLILVLTQLKPTIEAQISGRMVSSHVSDVVFASYTRRKPV